MRKRKFPYPLLALGVILITGIGFTNMRSALQVDEQQRLQEEAAQQAGKPSENAAKEAEDIAGQVSRSVPLKPRDYVQPKPKTTKQGKVAPPEDQTSGMWWDEENRVNNE